eukprot:15445531-Alexandrium_andersonii.AAC.1
MELGHPRTANRCLLWLSPFPITASALDRCPARRAPVPDPHVSSSGLSPSVWAGPPRVVAECPSAEGMVEEGNNGMKHL